MGESVIVADWLEPGASEKDVGEGWLMAAEIVKSGATGASTEGVPAIVTAMPDE